MPGPEMTREAAQAALDDTLTRLQENMITVLHLTPPVAWRPTLDRLRERIDAALKTATAEVGRDPVTRAQLAAAWPQLVAQQRDQAARAKRAAVDASIADGGEPDDDL